MIEVGQIKVIWCDLKYVVEFEDKKKKKKRYLIKICKLKDKQQNDQKKKDKQQNQLFLNGMKTKNVNKY